MGAATELRFNGTEWMIYERWVTTATVGAPRPTRAPAISRPRRRGCRPTTSVSRHHHYGQAFRLTNLEEFRPKIFEGANTLALRYLPQYGVTRSWDDTNGDVRVIIDNMMNIEVLFMAADLTSNTTDRDRWLAWR